MTEKEECISPVTDPSHKSICCLLVLSKIVNKAGTLLLIGQFNAPVVIIGPRADWLERDQELTLVKNVQVVLELAVSELLKTVKAIFRCLPACDIDEEKRVKLLNLGRFLRLLTAVRNPSNFFEFDFNLKELLLQSKQYSQDVQAHVIPFVSEYLNNNDDDAPFTTSVHTFNAQIEELLNNLNAKETNCGGDTFTRASPSEYCYIAFEQKGCASKLLENSWVQQNMAFIKLIHKMHQNYLKEDGQRVSNPIQVLSNLDFQMIRSSLISSSKYMNSNIVRKARSIIEDHGLLWPIFCAVGEFIKGGDKNVLNEVIQWLKRFMNSNFPKRNTFYDEEIQKIRNAVNAIVNSRTDQILQHIQDFMPDFIYSELTKLKQEIDKSTGMLLANSLTMQLLPACLAYFKMNTVETAIERLMLWPHLSGKDASSARGHSKSDRKLALDICKLISKVIKLTYSNRPHSNAISQLGNIFESIINEKSQNFDRIKTLICHDLSFLFLTNFNSQVEKESRNIYLQVVRMLKILQCPFWNKETITNEWIQLIRGKIDVTNQQESVNSVIWNWEAISELLEESLINHLKFDSLLSLNVKVGNERAVTLLLNLLDRFILPPIFGKRREDSIDRMLGKNVSTYLFSDLFMITHKRDFAVLNEFDLPKSTKALMDLQKFKIIRCKKFNLRLNVTCARIRALTNWDLLESTIDEMPLKGFRGGVGEKDETLEMKLFTKKAIYQWLSEYVEHKQNDPSTFNEWMDSSNWPKTISGLPKMALFLRICICLAFDNTLNFIAVSQFEALIDLMISCSKRFSNLIAIQRRLLIHIIDKLGRTLMQHHENNSCEFNPKLYQVFLLKLFEKLLAHFPAINQPNQSEEYCEIHRFIPIAFGYLLHQLRPYRMPKFASGFMEILQNDFFMKCFWIKTGDHAIPVERFEDTLKLYRKIYAQLLSDLTSHVILGRERSQLETSLINLWYKMLYKYPDFICEFYHYFSKVISVSKSSLRNIVAFAKPTSGCLMDELPEYTLNAGHRLPPFAKQSIDSDIKFGSPVNLNLLNDYLSRYLTISVLERSKDDNEREAAATQINMVLFFEAALRQMRLSYDVPNHNTYYPEFLADLVTYLGLHAVQNAELKNYLADDLTTVALLPEIVFLESFLQHLHECDQYILVCFLISQLRYESLWTLFFSQCLLVLLRKLTDSKLKDMIIRILIEYLQYGATQSDGLLFVCCNIKEKLDFPKLLKHFSDEERSLFDKAKQRRTKAN
ncbi:hypothetical protein ACTXT7_014036 [Hymenolepis weldensis]